MAEKSLNDPLADFEIKQIILDEIKARLDKDCTLTGGQAYAGFTAQFEIKVQYLRSLTQPTLVWGLAGMIDKPITPEDIESHTVVKDTYTSPAPNVARQDHDLPIPVMVQTPTGPQRRRVTIEKSK